MFHKILKFFGVLLLCFQVDSSVIPHRKKHSELVRIVNGRQANVHELSYLVSVQIFGMHICGGAIISDKFIITAAHCIFTEALYMTVKTGSLNLFEDDGQFSQVETYYVHELFQRKTLDYDIALLKLSNNLIINAFQHPINITNRPPESGLAIASGWGLTSEGGFMSAIAQSAVIPILSPETCSAIYKITPRMFCAGDLKGGTDACQGDSGGPLTFDNQLIGLVSWGIGCARTDRPGVYTNLYELRPFIKKYSGIV